MCLVSTTLNNCCTWHVLIHVKTQLQSIKPSKRFYMQKYSDLEEILNYCSIKLLQRNREGICFSGKKNYSNIWEYLLSPNQKHRERPNVNIFLILTEKNKPPSSAEYSVNIHWLQISCSVLPPKETCAPPVGKFYFFCQVSTKKNPFPWYN